MKEYTLTLGILNNIFEQCTQMLILRVFASIDRLYLKDVMEEDQILPDMIEWFEIDRLQEWNGKRCYTGHTKETNDLIIKDIYK